MKSEKKIDGKRPNQQIFFTLYVRFIQTFNDYFSSLVSSVLLYYSLMSITLLLFDDFYAHNHNFAIKILIVFNEYNSYLKHKFIYLIKIAKFNDKYRLI
jgi:hypothetical protein